MQNNAFLAQGYGEDIAAITARAEQERMAYMGQMMRALFRRLTSSSDNTPSLKMGQPTGG